MKDHSKSRRGCKQCKKRKIKCDESLPRCWNCQRRREHCSYLDEYYVPPASPTSGSGSTSRTSHVHSSGLRHPTSPAPQDQASSSAQPQPPQQQSQQSQHLQPPQTQHQQQQTDPSNSSSANASASASASASVSARSSPGPGQSAAPPQLSTAAHRGSTPFPSPGPAVDWDTYRTDLELTHFYLTNTFETLWSRPEHNSIQRDIVFQEALRQPALLDGILTTAALHKVVLLESGAGEGNGGNSSSSSSKWRQVALHKQRQALEGFLLLLQSLDEGSCRAIFPLSILVSIWAFASRNLPEDLGTLAKMDSLAGGDPTPQPEPQPHADHPTSDLELLIELFRRIRPVSTIAVQSRQWLLGGDMAALVSSPQSHELPPLPEGISNALDRLFERLGERAPSVLAALDEVPKHSLRFAFQISRSDWREVLVGWPMGLPAAFVEELQRRNGAALVVLAYWGVCLQVLDEKWWARGWAKALIDEVDRMVKGGEWEEMLEWPKMYMSIMY